jgi:hypothetical protein
MCLLHEIHETGNIALDVNVRVFQRVSYAGLRRQVNDGAKFFMIEDGLQAAPIGNVTLDKAEVFRCLENFQPGSLQAFIVKRAEIIETKNAEPGFKQPAAEMKANETRAAGYKYGIGRPDVFDFQNFYHHRKLLALPTQI